VTKKKLIFFDIDGTLVDGNGIIPVSTKEGIARLKELGHDVVIATGRAPFMFDDIRNELDIHSYVCFNGQLVVYGDRVIHKNPLNQEALKKLTAAAEENGHPIVHVDRFGIGASDPYHEYIIESMNPDKMAVPIVHNAHYYQGRDIIQSMLFLREHETPSYVSRFTDFRFTHWHPVSVDVDPADGSKAKGCEVVMEHLGYPSDHVYAFGDGLNDIDMLTFVPNSIAMGNAHPEVKQVSRFVTKSVNENGIYHGLKMVGLL
jgi:Cof subfamily protein (haloacid dehalogenase superfamily)